MYTNPSPISPKVAKPWYRKIVSRSILPFIILGILILVPLVTRPPGLTIHFKPILQTENSQYYEKEDNVIEGEWNSAKEENVGKVASNEFTFTDQENWKDISPSDVSVDSSTIKLRIHKVKHGENLYKIAKSITAMAQNGTKYLMLIRKH